MNIEMYETANNENNAPETPAPTPAPTKPLFQIPKTTWKKIYRIIIRVCFGLGKFFGSVALWELVGEWQPGFRQRFVDWYVFVDAIAKFFNDACHIIFR